MDKQYICSLYTQHFNMFKELRHSLYPYRKIVFNGPIITLPETNYFLEILYNYKIHPIAVSEVTLQISDQNIKVSFDSEVIRLKFTDSIYISGQIYDLPLEYFTFQTEDLSPIRFNQ
jgi:hypothetical protein